MFIDLQDIMQQTKDHFEHLVADDAPWPDQLVAIWDGAPMLYVYLATNSDEDMLNAMLTTCVGTACDAVMAVVDTYRTTLATKLDGTPWEHGEMERAFVDDAAEKPFIHEALTITLVDRLQNLTTYQYQYKRDGKNIVWEQSDYLEEGTPEAQDVGQTGFFADGLRTAMGMKTLLDRFREHAPAHAASLMAEKNLYEFVQAELLAQTAQRLLEIGLPVALGAQSEAQMKVYKQAFPEGTNFRIDDDGTVVRMDVHHIQLNKEDEDD